eukprot:UN08382
MTCGLLVPIQVQIDVIVLITLLKFYAHREYLQHVLGVIKYDEYHVKFQIALETHSLAHLLPSHHLLCYIN